MRGKKIKLLASVIGIILVVIAVIAGFGWKEHKLKDAQQEFTSLIEAKEGNYNENKVVLSSPQKKKRRRWRMHSAETVYYSIHRQWIILKIMQKNVVENNFIKLELKFDIRSEVLNC